MQRVPQKLRGRRPMVRVLEPDDAAGFHCRMEQQNCDSVWGFFNPFEEKMHGPSSPACEKERDTAVEI